MLALNGKVYIIAGFDKTGQRTTTVEMYDPISNKILDQIIKSKVSNVANAIVIINDNLVKFQFQKLDPTQTDIYFQVKINHLQNAAV